jgi:hypothetical protein
MKDALGHGSNPRGARAERVALNRQIDERHFPSRSNAEATAKTDLGRPQGRDQSLVGAVGYGAKPLAAHQLATHLATVGKRLPS